MAQTKKASTAKKTGGKTSSAKKTGKSSTSKKTTTKSKKVEEPIIPPAPAAPPIRREVSALVFLFLAVFMVISHFNSDGKFIVYFSTLIKGLVGWGFWLYVPAFLVAAAILGFHKGFPVSLRVFCALFIPVLVAAIGHLFFYDDLYIGQEISLVSGQLFEQGQYMDCGGVLGGLIAIALGNALSTYGALPVLMVALIFCFVKCFQFRFGDAMNKARERAHVIKYDPSMYVVNTPMTDDEEFVAPVMLNTTAPRAPARNVKKIERIPREAYSVMDIPMGGMDDILPLVDLRDRKQESYYSEAPEPRKPARSTKKPAAPMEKPPMPTMREMPPVREKPPVKKTELHSSVEEEARRAGVDIDELRNTVDELMRPVAMSAEISDPPKKKLSRSELAAEAQAVADEISANEAVSDYEFPPISLLRGGISADVDARDEIRLNRERLEGALHSFGIHAAIVGVTHGPTVTRYDIELEQGVKLARVTNLAGDLALALGVINVRIAPIPDRISTVGIEVPNKFVSTVYLRDIIESPKFQSAKSKLSFSLGKDIGGDSVVGNIAKMPHLLIAGTTGSGKSVCMNSLIMSILYKARPDEVRFIMIDPKMVELGIYNGIPHLYVPVVTDPKKAAGALQWSVVEMLKRYRLFSEIGVRDLESYNRHCVANGEDKLPQVVIIIDELADLMMIASKEVEESICRVAQMGRAAGMHLVVATQRPSADVITGLMKANIPSRIAFAVSSSLESRIILDQTGAEKLVGMGDMLFSPVGLGKPMRIQGAFVSDDERENVIQFIKEGAAPSESNSELEAYMNKSFDEKTAAESGGKAPKEEESMAGEYDAMLPQAVEVILETKSCSVSMLQRRVKLGYSRAARIVDQMEELGIVGPYEGAKPRRVIVDREGWNKIQVQLGMAVAEDFPPMDDYPEPNDDPIEDFELFDE